MSQVIDDLKELVLNERQAKVYHAILKNNNLTITDIQNTTGLVRNKIYDTVKFLTGNGFCTKSSDSRNNITYSAIHPNVSFQKVIEKKENDLHKTKILIDNLIEIYHSKPIQGDLTQYLEVVNGNRNVHKKFIELLNNAKHTVLSISRPPYSTMSQKENDQQHQAAKNFLARGGVDISITQMNENSPLFIFNNLRFTKKSYKPEHNKLTYQSPIKLFIFDNETLMTFNETFANTSKEICASIIKQPNTVATYIHLFNFLFQQAIPVETWLKENKDLFEQKLKEYDEFKKSKNDV